jgi:hypothetical protein
MKKNLQNTQNTSSRSSSLRSTSATLRSGSAAKHEGHRRFIFILSWVLFLIFLTNFSFAGKVATFTEFVNPYSILIDGDRLYISEGVTVFIYSLKDYRLVKKFGREGEGPGEVLLRRRVGNTEITLSADNQYLIVNTSGKVIYFTKDGEFVKEKRIETTGRWLAPLGDCFVGRKFTQEPDGLYHSIVIYDSNLKKIKEIYRHIHGFQGARKKFNPLTVEQADFNISDDKIFVIDGARTKIIVYNKKGEPLFTITPKDEMVPFTEEDKKSMVEGYKRNPFWKRFYERRKDLFKFPKFYPPIRWFFLDPIDKKIYLKTQKIEKGKRKWLVFDFSGTFIKQLFLPQGFLRFYNGKYYCFVENEEEEVWELFVERVK